MPLPRGHRSKSMGARGRGVVSLRGSIGLTCPEGVGQRVSILDDKFGTYIPREECASDSILQAYVLECEFTRRDLR